MELAGNRRGLTIVLLAAPTTAELEQLIRKTSLLRHDSTRNEHSEGKP